MRKIRKDFDFRFIPKKLSACTKKNEKDLLKSHTVKDSCYKKSKIKLEKQFHRKCAYCETSYLTTSDTWIEHYRPKSKYYWLAYEWSNLLPTCTKCNRSKKDNFPLIGTKITSPPLTKSEDLDTARCRADHKDLMGEKPYLLHPKIDNPSDYLTFEIDKSFKGIALIGIDKNKRGEETINICGLNREDLIVRRYEVIVEIANIINLLLMAFKYKTKKYPKIIKIVFDEIRKKAEKDELEYTLLRKTLLNKDKFKELVLPVLENKNLAKIISKLI